MLVFFIKKRVTLEENFLLSINGESVFFMWFLEERF